jgi:enoyl-CoA hydratase/carnithine racemase
MSIATVSTRPELVVQERADVVILTMNQPASRNALSEAMLEALHQALARAAASRSVKVVVLAANGPAFCSGHDLKQLSAHRSDTDRGQLYFDTLVTRCADLMTAIIALPQPVIAAVEGVASAAGCMLVACCDLAVAGEAAEFCTPGVHIGLFCSTPMVPLARNVARKHAMEMLLTADRISAPDAYRFGLVNRVVATDQALSEAMLLAQKIARQSPTAVQAGKRAFYHQIELPFAEALADMARAMACDLLDRDAEEGIAAFLHKRSPFWGHSDDG